MKIFNNLKLGRKYGVILSVVLLLFFASSIMVGIFLNNMYQEIDVMENRGEKSVQVTELGSLIRAKMIWISQYKDNPSLETEADFSERNDRFEKIKETLEQNITDAEQKNLLQRVISLNYALNESFTNIVSYMNQDDLEMAEGEVQNATAYQLEVINQLEELEDMVNMEFMAASEHAKDSQREAMVTLVITISVSVVLSVLLIYVVTRRISRPLSQLLYVSEEIADGNLQVEPIDYSSKDEIGQLSTAVNVMSNNLRNILQQVTSVSNTVTSQSNQLNQSANEVNANAQQISVTMEEIASGTETQANHAGDVASKMGDFSQKLKAASEDGESLGKTSAHVLDMTKDGQKMMRSSVEHMEQIHHVVHEAVDKVKVLDAQSQEISKLVAVIRDIAEQTNLLALNAAIESARAGEHGKGFAVVADEVRKLAEQVTASVSDITGIVTNIQTESSNVSQSLEEGYQSVDDGSVQIEKTGSTFESINEAVNEMTMHIKHSTSNLTSIARSSEEINTSVEEIASITEESAAGVQQTSASAEEASGAMEEITSNSKELTSLAEQLNGLVGKFRL
ncbi:MULTISPECIES: methyl-accepting chemotaxis protein [Gracilibacillus]|uniref:methyl-accepting chemotaxis protein n=1 Tax=Gracilibacillus TaxID=74385 RepID=UPI000826F172|nr:MULTISPECIES: HAMP domain-containing methyl-accepting chemotaxis protein [Gracilibacillus]